MATDVARGALDARTPQGENKKSGLTFRGAGFMYTTQEEWEVTFLRKFLLCEEGLTGGSG